jgi:hypothetical protein
MTNEERNALITQYSAGYAEVVAALEGFTAEELDARPLPGKWSAREIAHHLAESEMNSALRIRRLLAEDNPLIPGYDQDFYSTRFFHNGRDLAPALDAFRGARGVTVPVIMAMSEADWQRAGTHSESGRYTAEDWLRIYARHAHNHAAQIRALRAALDEQRAAGPAA